MSEKILEAFKKLKSQLDVRDYDDERFIKDLPENEPVSLVIPFERTGRGYLDIFRSYIGGGEHPELSDEELLEQYLESSDGKEDKLWGDMTYYTLERFKGAIEECESIGFKGKPELNRNRFSEDEVTKLIQALKEKGINAVSKRDEKSKDPSTVVVMNNGMIMPFMDKETISLMMPQIKKVMSDCSFSVGGHIAPITFEQLRSPFETECNPERTDFMRNFMHDFLNQPCFEIKSLDNLTISDGKIKLNNRNELFSIDKENDKAKRPYIWRGGVLGDKPFIANIDTENFQAHVLRKSWAMATPSIEYAIRYAARDPDHPSFYGIGFLYQYNTTGKEEYFSDRGIEKIPTTILVPGAEETPLSSGEHSIANIFFYYATSEGDHAGRYLMRLDLNNPTHQKLLKLYEPKEKRLSPNLLQRRINQFNEASANNGHPNAYKPIISKTEDKRLLKGISGRLSKNTKNKKNLSRKNICSTKPHNANLSR